MGITVDRTIRMTREERDAFVRWADEFTERALDSGRDCWHGERNLRRAMVRKYGHPAYMITGSNNDYTLNLGSPLAA